ncbi:hypothetical protein K435DRAFT_858961 [Dendrothele bispora CBS 962.96]|uniref:Uncharacterized protein n=1 Tax=Dendrothele bispora (strain CBS 962.96) TaxID=1314807 RepID=A0A4S8M2D3_DENBC|nr:hypothetical protein K435DRAFT_858961 [Dendrothele bispora CBS 962.96]
MFISQTTSQNSSLPQVIYRNFSQNSLTFRLFYPEGTNLRISVAQNDSSIKYSPLVDDLAVAAGTNDSCLMHASMNSQSQAMAANSISRNVPQCGSLQANIAGSVIYINSNTYYTDKNLIATSPSTIMYIIGDGQPATFDISVPYPAGTLLSFQSGDVSSLKALVGIEEGNNNCLLADLPPNFTTSSLPFLPPTSSISTPSKTSSNPSSTSSLQNDSNDEAKIIPAVIVPVKAINKTDEKGSRTQRNSYFRRGFQVPALMDELLIVFQRFTNQSKISSRTIGPFPTCNPSPPRSSKLKKTVVPELSVTEFHDNKVTPLSPPQPSYHRRTSENYDRRFERSFIRFDNDFDYAHSWSRRGNGKAKQGICRF